MENKSEIIRCRVTPEMKKRFIEKAYNAGYSSLSSYIIDVLDNTSHICDSKKFELLAGWNDSCIELRSSISRLSSNLNQLAKYENLLSCSGVANPVIQEENQKNIAECLSLLSKLHKENLLLMKKMRL